MRYGGSGVIIVSVRYGASGAPKNVGPLPNSPPPDGGRAGIIPKIPPPAPFNGGPGE